MSDSINAHLKKALRYTKKIKGLAKTMAKPRFLEAPVMGEQISDFFSLSGESGPLPQDVANELAEEINREVVDGTALWINPETDRSELKIHGHRVAIAGRALRAVGGEVAIFPPVHHRDERKSA